MSKKRVSSYDGHPFRIEWLPERNDLRTTDTVISIGYERKVGKKSIIQKKVVTGPKKHVIHKAIKWKKMLEDGKVNSLSEIARKEGLSRTRITQTMNLLKLPAKAQKFLVDLNDPKEIRRHSERRLRQSLSSLFEQMGQNTVSNEKV
ncbi:MAG: hypothetical protein PVI53_20375 [Desulfobacteraceae bacterium]|jgi:hypothetical protein